MLWYDCEAVLQHIWALEGEREARGQEATEAAQKHAQALEQVKLRDMAAADLQKKVPPAAPRPFACLPAQASLLGGPVLCLHAYLSCTDCVHACNHSCLLNCEPAFLHGCLSVCLLA